MLFSIVMNKHPQTLAPGSAGPWLSATVYGRMLSWILHAPVRLYRAYMQRSLAWAAERDALLASGICVQCKKRPAEMNNGKCETCFGAWG